MDWFSLDETQRNAISACLDKSKRLTAISGAAGTGKTTIMQLVYDKLTDVGYDPVLCAPTGKAARRITEATGFQASTIHKLLEFPHPNEIDESTGKSLNPTRPKRHRQNPLAYTAVLVDEAAMVNNELFTDLSDAMPSGSKLCLFGDINQLPPIEPNGLVNDRYSPFHRAMYDVTPKGLIVKGNLLTKIHRQGEGSGIVKNGMHILAGRYPARFNDFSVISTKYHITRLKELLDDEDGPDFTSIDNQIIVPGNKGWVGTRKLNAILQAYLNPHFKDKGLTVARHKWDEHDGENYWLAVDDKVIVTANMYDVGLAGIMNGETGKIIEITEFGELIIDFGTEIISIPPNVVSTYNGKDKHFNPQKCIDLAYCVTTHKTQGSEYQEIVYIIDPCHRFVLHRNNFYTAVTRARKRATIIFDSRAMSNALAVRPPQFKPKVATHV